MLAAAVELRRAHCRPDCRHRPLVRGFDRRRTLLCSTHHVHGHRCRPLRRGHDDRDRLCFVDLSYFEKENQNQNKF